MANSVYPDETAHNGPSHLDLHCLQNNLSRSIGLKGLNKKANMGIPRKDQN